MNVREAKALRNAPLHVATDLKWEAVQDIFGRDEPPPHRYVCSLREDKKLPLGTSQVPIFATIIFSLMNKAIRSLPRRTQSRNVFGKLAVSPCTRSVTSAACSACLTTMQITLRPWTCSLNCATITSSS